MSTRTLPTLWQLTPGQREATHCVWCGAPLGENAIRAGLAVGYWGAHNRSVAVYQHPTSEQGDPQCPSPASSPPATSRPALADSAATAG